MVVEDSSAEHDVHFADPSYRFGTGDIAEDELHPGSASSPAFFELRRRAEHVDADDSRRAGFSGDEAGTRRSRPTCTRYPRTPCRVHTVVHRPAAGCSCRRCPPPRAKAPPPLVNAGDLERSDFPGIQHGCVPGTLTPSLRTRRRDRHSAKGPAQLPAISTNREASG